MGGGGLGYWVVEGGWSLTLGLKGGKCPVIPPVHWKGLPILGSGHQGHLRLCPRKLCQLYVKNQLRETSLAY